MRVRGLVELDGESLLEADRVLDRVSHDVAKYMAMTARNVVPEAVTAEERRYILNDLKLTDGRRPAWDLWAESSNELAALASDRMVEEIDEAMKSLMTLVTEVELGRGRVEVLVELCLATADRIGDLRRAVRHRLIAEGG